ncbi:hypothetical protein [Streptomyces sp. NPDC002889]|uniref:hypothetical protein n=1 Tax=Streptomyces sp. NPDC002889 TaxID=3364669 RepID=UPI0036881CB1
MGEGHALVRLLALLADGEGEKAAVASELRVRLGLPCSAEASAGPAVRPGHLGSDLPLY